MLVSGRLARTLHLKNVTSLFVQGDLGCFCCLAKKKVRNRLLVFTKGFHKRNTRKKFESRTRVYHCLYSHHLMVALPYQEGFGNPAKKEPAMWKTLQIID